MYCVYVMVVYGEISLSELPWSKVAAQVITTGFAMLYDHISPCHCILSAYALCRRLCLGF